MEFEQIAKRLEWLDEQHRKNKETISDINSRLTDLESSVNALSKQTKSLTKELVEIGPVAARMNQFDDILEKQRSELNKALDTVEKTAQNRKRESSRLHQSELKQINARVTELHTSFGPDGLQKQYKDQAIELKRLSLAMQDIQTRLEQALTGNTEVLRIQKEY